VNKTPPVIASEAKQSRRVKLGTSGLRRRFATRNDKLVLVVGPTASGKSEYAQVLALRIGGEIINADSQQFFQGLDIGTGKPPLQEQKVPHWLFDVCPPGRPMNAMDFADRADDLIAKIIRSGKIPFVVGGTGLYLRALLEGLDKLPSRDPKVRQKLEKILEEGGPSLLHDRLRQVDPKSAENINPNDRSRLVRYLEIYELSGRPPSQLLKQGRPEKLRYQVQTHWLNPPREWTRQNIRQRVGKMLTSGWVEEVRQLMKKGADPRDWENKPIGYSDLAGFILGRGTMTFVQENIVQKTCQYAKRQSTFFRGLFKNPAYVSQGNTLNIKSDPPFYP